MPINNVLTGYYRMRFIRDILAISLGVFLGFLAIIHTHNLVDVVFAFVQLKDMAFLTNLNN